MGEGTDRIRRMALAQGVPEDASVVQALIISKLDAINQSQKETHGKVETIAADLAEVKTKVALIEQKQNSQDSDIYDNKRQIIANRDHMQRQVEDIKKTTKYLPALLLVFTGSLTAAGAWAWNAITSLANHTPPPGP